MTQRDAEIGPLVSSLRDHGWHTAASALLQYAEREQRLRDALDILLKHYVRLADSGDCGFWNPEDETEVKAARAALAEGSGIPTEGI